MADWPSPLTTIKAVEQFLGLANYFRKFIRGFGAVTAPLTRLRRKNSQFVWTDACQKAFDYVRQALTSAPVLAPPDTTPTAAPFEVICDASGDGIGAGLFQDKQVVAFEGRKYRPAEYNYTVGEQELLAVVHALQVWRCYLEGAPAFRVITDHNPLVYLSTQQNLSRRQARWVEFMQRFDFTWVYRPGRFNVADPLSRAPSLPHQPLAHLHDGLALTLLPQQEQHAAVTAASPFEQSHAVQALSVILFSIPLSYRHRSWPGGNTSAVLAAMSEVTTRRRSQRIADQDKPHEAEASVTQRRASVWAPDLPESRQARGSVTGQGALTPEGGPLSTEDHSASPASCFEANGSNASGDADEDAGSLSDQVASDEELSELVVDFLDAVREGYKKDQYFSKQGNLTPFVLDDGLYWRSHQLVIPNYQQLRQRCLELTHDAPWAGHFGRDKTSALVTSLYWWPGIHKDVEQYVRTCPGCQRNKAKRAKPFGLMVPLQVPQRRWTSIGVDFITHLPSTATKRDAIAVFVDRLTKRVHLEPCNDDTTAEQFAEIFLKAIFCQHGLPLDIVSDRDSRFTSAFWTEVCRLLGIKQNMSTAFHPQTDGQTERVNRTLEEVLRAYVSEDHSDWDKRLPLVEFAINNAVQASTGTTPFLMDTGQSPLTPNMAVLARANPKSDAYPFVGRWRETAKMVRQNLHNAQNRQKQLHDRRVTDKEFKVGQRVLLSSKNMKKLLGESFDAQRSFKLMGKHLGPFPVLDRIGKAAYKLDLSSASLLKDIHPVFHVSLLRDFHESQQFPRATPHVDIVDGEVHHKVKCFSDFRTHYGHRQWFVEFQDGSPGNWTFEVDLRDDMPKAIDRFIAQYNAANKDRKRPATRRNRGRGRKRSKQ